MMVPEDPVWVNVLAQHADVVAECLAAWACVHAAVEACWAALVGVWALSCLCGALPLLRVSGSGVSDPLPGSPASMRVIAKSKLTDR